MAGGIAISVGCRCSRPAGTRSASTSTSTVPAPSQAAGRVDARPRRRGAFTKSRRPEVLRGGAAKRTTGRTWRAAGGAAARGRSSRGLKVGQSVIVPWTASLVACGVAVCKNHDLQAARRRASALHCRTAGLYITRGMRTSFPARNLIAYMKQLSTLGLQCGEGLAVYLPELGLPMNSWCRSPWPKWGCHWDSWRRLAAEAEEPPPRRRANPVLFVHGGARCRGSAGRPRRAVNVGTKCPSRPVKREEVEKGHRTLRVGARPDGGRAPARSTRSTGRRLAVVARGFRCKRDVDSGRRFLLGDDRPHASARRTTSRTSVAGVAKQHGPVHPAVAKAFLLHATRGRAGRRPGINLRGGGGDGGGVVCAGAWA